MSGIPINSGTGPSVAVDQVGTDNYQLVKIVQATAGSAGVINPVMAVTNTGTSAVTVANVLTASGVTIASIATGTVTVVGTVAVSGGGGGVQYNQGTTSIAATGTGTIAMGIQGTTAFSLTVTSSGRAVVHVANVISASGVTVATVTTLLGVVSVSGGGGGAQYPVDSTAMGSTGTATIVMGMQSGATTARGFAMTTTGGLHTVQNIGTIGATVVVTGTVGALMLQSLDATNDSVGVFGLQTGSAIRTAIAVSTTGGLYIASGAGGGVQYGVGDTSMAATATGTLVLGMQSGATTARGLALTTTGGIFTIQTVATLTTLLGTVSVSGGGGGVQYSNGDTSIAATGTGTIAFGVQSGATTARAIALTTSGAQHVNIQNTAAVTVASITTGTLNVINTVAISGSASVINTVAISGTVSAGLVTTTASVAVIGTAHASRFQAYALATTSAGAGVIVKTSGASTIYVTDVLISVPSAMNVGLYSETTGPLALVYLASQGGWAQDFRQPLVCTTAQSLRVILSSSGTCSITVIGYTFT